MMRRNFVCSGLFVILTLVVAAALPGYAGDEDLNTLIVVLKGNPTPAEVRQAANDAAKTAGAEMVSL